MSEDNALDVQVGGNHYKKWKVQPVEYITIKHLSFLRGCIIKRLMRDKDSLEDLKKILHELELLRQLEHDKPSKPFEDHVFFHQDGMPEEVKRLIARITEEQRLTEEHGPNNEISLMLIESLKRDVKQMIDERSPLLSK